MYILQRVEDGLWFAAKYQKLKDRSIQRHVSSEYDLHLKRFLSAILNLANMFLCTYVPVFVSEHMLMLQYVFDYT